MELRIVRTFAAPLDKVFRAWTDVESIKQWFPYKGNVHWRTHPTADTNVGAHFSWSVVSDENDTEAFHFHGTYREYRSPSKLAFTWEWESLPIPGLEGPGNTLVTLEFVNEGKETAVTLAQTGFASLAAHDAHEKGWNRCFDGIEQVLRERNRDPAKSACWDFHSGIC
jgi:uncharacterized protein YndB with AHSA1/START domain